MFAMEVRDLNQILVTEKLYVTPELKRKKKAYKIQFFICILLVLLLSSYYIYAEYDRNKREEVSQKVLAQVKSDETVKNTSNDSIIIVLSEEESNEAQEMEVEEEDVSQNAMEQGVIEVDGVEYNTEAIVTIPKIDISYPVLTETSDELLNISVNKFWGPNPNEIGNYCIAGHNYRNGKMFGRLNELENGDIVELQDLSGRVVEHEVYYIYVVEPEDRSCTSQLTNRRELTLITCTNYGTQRLIVKCREI